MDRLSRPEASHTPAAVPISFKHFLAKPSKVFLVLPLERVAHSTHPMREDLRFPRTCSASRAVWGFAITSPRSISFQNHDIDQPAINEEDRTLVCSHGVRPLLEIPPHQKLHLSRIPSDHFAFKFVSF